MSDAVTLDLVNLASDLRKAAQQAETSVFEIVMVVAKRIEEEMKALVPVKTGKLRDSIRIKTAPGRIEIGPEGVDYAVYIEYGTGSMGEFPTGPYEIHPKKPGGTLIFKVDGKTVGAKMVIHPGIRPKPFARPAAAKWLDSLGDDVAKVGVEMIVGKTING